VRVNYFIANGGQQRGPFPLDKLLVEGLRSDSMVWREGMPEWKQAGEVPELRALLGMGDQPPIAPPAINQPLPNIPPYAGAAPYNQADASSKKIAAGILGILLGGFGIHKFILGMTLPGIIMLAVTICTCGFGAIVMHPIGLIEGIIYLTKTDEEFYRVYMVEKRQWF
jgi:TM2 domain-containing membrane protein YozV